MSPELTEAYATIERLRRLADEFGREARQARADARTAFTRGAEEMRLACQEWCRAWENDGDAIADALADLRVEDKP